MNNFPLLSPIPPHAGLGNVGALAEIKEMLVHCAQVCYSCADAYPVEKSKALLGCVELCLDCAAICGTTAKHLSQLQMAPEFWQVQLQACAEACRACADANRSQAGKFALCVICAECCLRCGRRCNEALAELLFEQAIKVG